MNKAIRFARENEPELLAKQQAMIEEIKRIRAENNYELYKPYYEQELNKQSQLAREKRLEHSQEQSKDYESGPNFW
jgi:hypothetical protein